jgi:hypothetical protein
MKTFHLDIDHISEMIHVMKTVLTQIPIDEMTKGIAYCRSKTDRVGKMNALNAFWTYFTSTWLMTYKPYFWNVFGIELREHIYYRVVNRTNNPLERHNRELNKLFGSHKPTMEKFVDIIKSESCHSVNDNKLIDGGLKGRPNHQAVTMYEIPTDYASFEF